MSVLDRLRLFLGQKAADAGETRASVQQPAADSAPGHPRAVASEIFSYIRGVLNGGARDDQKEARAFSRELGLDTIDLAEMLYKVAITEGVSVEQVAHFLAIGATGGGDAGLAILVRRISILAEHYSEIQREALLRGHVVGDGEGIGPFAHELDSVGIAVKYCLTVKALKSLAGHDRIDPTTVEIKADEDWDD